MVRDYTKGRSSPSLKKNTEWTLEGGIQNSEARFECGLQKAE